jgi:hypothetical protein
MHTFFKTKEHYLQTMMIIILKKILIIELYLHNYYSFNNSLKIEKYSITSLKKSIL